MQAARFEGVQYRARYDRQGAERLAVNRPDPETPVEPGETLYRYCRPDAFPPGRRTDGTTPRLSGSRYDAWSMRRVSRFRPGPTALARFPGSTGIAMGVLLPTAIACCRSPAGRCRGASRCDTSPDCSADRDSGDDCNRKKAACDLFQFFFA